MGEIDVDIEVRDDVFYLTPLSCMYTGKRVRTLSRIDHPLTFTHDYASRLWKDQIRLLGLRNADLLAWVFDEICRIVKDHKPATRRANFFPPATVKWQ